MFTLGKPLNGQRMYDNTQRPIITQLFGENLNNFYHQWGLDGHNGIDYRTKHFDKGHAPIFATHDGWVISDKTIQSDTKGRYVNIISDEVMIDGKLAKVRTIYFHLSECLVSRDNREAGKWYQQWFNDNSNYIKQGQIIGYGGNTGQATTGPHLHLGMFIYWKMADGTFKLDYNNGYKGAVDPMKYIHDNIVYQRGEGIHGRKFYFNGEKISIVKAKKLILKHNVC